MSDDAENAGIVTIDDDAGQARRHAADARRHREGGQQGPPPGDHLRRPVRARHRVVGDPGRLRRQRDVRRRGPAAVDRRAGVRRWVRGPRAGDLAGAVPRRRDGDRPRDDGDREPAQRRRHPLPVLVVRQQLRQLQRRRRRLRGDDRRRRRRGGGDDGGADPQARQGRAAGDAGVHHRVRRRAVEHRHRRRLPHPRPARRGRVLQRRSPPARRPRRRVCRA